MVRETWVQSQDGSYQRLLKWYLTLLCLTFSNIRYISRVNWSNLGKGVATSPTLQCSSYWKGSLQVALDCSHQLYFTYFRSALGNSFQNFKTIKRFKLWITGQKPAPEDGMEPLIRCFSLSWNHWTVFLFACSLTKSINSEMDYLWLKARHFSPGSFRIIKIVWI